MVSVGTVLAGRYCFRDHFRDAGWRWGRVTHHLAVVAFVLLMWVAPTALVWGFGLARPPALFRATNLWVMPAMVALDLVPGFGEEFGWRGYMLPRLARRFSPRWAVLIHAVVWWAWHLPVVIGLLARAGAAQATEMGLPVPAAAALGVIVGGVASFVPVVLHAVVFAYIWKRTGSILVATVYHAAFDGVRDSLPALEMFTTATAIWSNVVILSVGALLLWRADWSTLCNDGISARAAAIDPDVAIEIPSGPAPPAPRDLPVTE